jgi:hypothetical protein
MLQTLIDTLSDEQRLWLRTLQAALKKQLNLPLPRPIYDTFATRKWITGTPFACKLNAEGAVAAIRLLKEEHKPNKKHK